MGLSRKSPQQLPQRHGPSRFPEDSRKQKLGWVLICDSAHCNISNQEQEAKSWNNRASAQVQDVSGLDSICPPLSPLCLRA